MHHTHLCTARLFIKSTGHLCSKVSTKSRGAVRSRRSRGSRVSGGARLTISAAGTRASLLSFVSSRSAESLLSWWAHGAGWSSWSYNISNISRLSFLTLSARYSNGWRWVSRADRATLSKWDFRFGTAFNVLADYFITQDSSGVAHTDATRLRFPHILVAIALSVLYTAQNVLLVVILTSHNG